MSLALHQFLMLYMWFPLTTLLIFLFLIARFYQRFSGKQTYFMLFLVPVVLFGAGAVRYASVEPLAGNVFADILLGVGGIVLFFLSIRLYLLMLYKRGEENGN